MASQTEHASPQFAGSAAPAETVQAATATGKRVLFVDNLRILLITLVVVQHLSVTYGATGFWYYRDPATDTFTSIFLTIYDGVGQAAGMGFFFLIAGYFTPGSFDRKGGASFLRDRFIRLGIPMLLYVLLLDPLVTYLAGGLHGSYWSFYGSYMLQVRGVTGPVWFIAVLLIFDILYATWRWLTRHRPQVYGKSEKLPGYAAIAGFILALGIACFVVRIWWPVSWVFLPLNLNVGYLPQYISLYVLGLVAARRNWFFALTTRMARDWTLAALLATIAWTCLFVPYLQGGTGRAGEQLGTAMTGGFHLLSFGYTLWESFIVVGVCIGFLVLFRTHWNRQGRLAKGLAASAYTVYLIHPVVLVGFCYAFHTVALYPLLKFGIAVLITLPLCFLISSFIHKIPLANRIL
jgi:surface polysaccharide O-acyltransferase-like enzyme